MTHVSLPTGVRQLLLAAAWLAGDDGAPITRQLGEADVTSPVPTWLHLEVPSSCPRVPWPDGPVPHELHPDVCDATGDVTGYVVVWVEDGRLSAVEHPWYTDDPPAAWPQLEDLVWAGYLTGGDPAAVRRADAETVERLRHDPEDDLLRVVVPLLHRHALFAPCVPLRRAVAAATAARVDPDPADGARLADAHTACRAEVARLEEAAGGVTPVSALYRAYLAVADDDRDVRARAGTFAACWRTASGAPPASDAV